jgi:lipopolysaccharide transport system ATP-binding protein
MSADGLPAGPGGAATDRGARPGGARHDDAVVAVAENLGKSYVLWSRPQDRLKHSLLGRFGRSQPQAFWALRHVGFAIRRGEAVGIVGRNGSGKSTLLEILAGTVAPTEGQVTLRGKVAALLELGSGFNPEFTGRENVFINGSILGLSVEEVRDRFEEIAAFADIGPFMEQPVRVYSSGMVMRLAFAVQAVVPKEVLIVDEALSVGDEAFQQKCMAVMKRFQDDGGTVLLVSHGMQTIVRHCERCLLLHEGRLIADDEAKIVTDVYQKLIYSPRAQVGPLLADLERLGPRDLVARADRAEVAAGSEDAAPPPTGATDWYDPDMPRPMEVSYGNGDAAIEEAGFYALDGRRVNVVVAGRRYVWRYRAVFRADSLEVNFGMMLKTIDGVDVAGLSSDREFMTFPRVEAGTVMEVAFEFQLNVVPDTYLLNAGVGGVVGDNFTYLARRVDVQMIKVLPADLRPRHGIAELDHAVRCTRVEPAARP